MCLGVYHVWLNCQVQQSIESSGYTSSCFPLSFQERIEQGMVLQGAIAIQDDLVRDVYYSVKKLQTAGIRFWILTGDKADTAKAIGVRGYEEC